MDATNEQCYIVLHVGSGPTRAAEQFGSPLIVRDGNNRFTLTNDIWIERLDKQFATNIQKACQPPHYNMGAADNDRHLYAFVRRATAGEKTKYEGMTELHGLIALSRLVNPTSTGDRYSALVFNYGAKDSAIFSIQYSGMSDVFLAPAKPRDWLSVDDGNTLLKLMPWLSRKMHDRVHHAYWNHEYAMRSYYLDARWTLVVSGLEALINVGEAEVAWQFRDRVRQLAGEFQINLSDNDLRLAYKLRSKLVHAESFLSGLQTVLPTADHSALYDKLESLLRMTVRRCLLDQTFGDSFRDAAAVKARWPLSPNPNRRAKKHSWLRRKLQAICNHLP
jgi:hypothetical protein